MEFYICKHCGNLITILNKSGAPISCCGDNMTLLTANTVEASLEKHVPVVEIVGDTVTVKVGSVIHPMLPEHHISWIVLETEKGYQFKRCEGKPEAVFNIAGDRAVAAYEYCNLHGLWKKEI